MKHADGLKASWTTLCHAMQTDTRFTPDELAGLTAVNVIQDANEPTTQPQDMLIVQCMKKFCTQMPGNYTQEATNGRNGTRDRVWRSPS